MNFILAVSEAAVEQWMIKCENKTAKTHLFIDNRCIAQRSQGRCDFPS